jgi:GGDEF domain-containing protein
MPGLDESRPPFRADHVGSLLRPPELHAARAARKAGPIDAARLRARLKSGIVFATTAKGKPVFVSASVGAASYPENGTTVSELLESADKSMYAQKRGSSVAI